LWVGFPTLVGPTAVVDGVEFWADPATWVLLLDPWPSARAYRVPMAAFPPTGGVSLSMQLHCLLDPTPGAGSFLFTPVTHAPGCVSEFVASPALWAVVWILMVQRWRGRACEARHGRSDPR
jgi:hypothetical protein